MKWPCSHTHWSTDVDAGGETDFAGHGRHAVPSDWLTLGLYVFSVQLTSSLGAEPRARDCQWQRGA